MREACCGTLSADKFLQRLGIPRTLHFDAGKSEAVEKYFGMVFDNSQYPEDWPWPPTCTYDAISKELSIELEFPAPTLLPTARQYKYAKAKDEI